MNWLRGPLGNVRIVLILIACLGILIGTHGWQMHERFQSIKTGFHSTQATVELLEFEQSLTAIKGEMVWVFTPSIVYRYEVDGRERRGKRIDCEESDLYGKAAMQEFESRYSIDSMETCYYDPADPTDVMLFKPKVDRSTGYLNAAGICLFTSLFGIGMIQVLTGRSARVAPRRRAPPTWSPEDAGPNDPLARTRQIYRERLENRD